ncbi:MAG: acyltransferase family protein [Acidobacteriota bacterium]
MPRSYLSSLGEPNRLHVLKGLAILIYLSSHFRAVCWAEDKGVLGYSNAAVGLFFLASGYGLFHSLWRRLGEGRTLASWAGRFWRDRLIRLYPQYILALALMPVLFGRAVAWWQVLGVDSPYWTIGQALQCYMVAPVLFAMAQSNSRAVRWMPLAGMAALNGLALSLAGEIDRSGMLNQFVYRNLYGTHLALFHLGMLAAADPPGQTGRTGRVSRAGGPALAAMWLGALLVCGAPAGRVESAVRAAAAAWTGWAGIGAITPGEEEMLTGWVVAVLTIAGVAASTVFFKAYLALPRKNTRQEYGTSGMNPAAGNHREDPAFQNSRLRRRLEGAGMASARAGLRETLGGILPGSGFLALLGRNSLSIYLFEPVFYLVMFKLSLLEVRRWKSILWFAALSPVMFAVCVGLQKIQGAALRKLTGRA